MAYIPVMRINALNDHAIDLFLLKLAGDKQPLGFYLQTALKKSILKEESFFETQATYPADPPPWLTREKFDGGSFHVFSEENTKRSAGKLKHIKDWIGAAIASNDEWIHNKDEQGRPVRLLQISSIENAHQRADKDMRHKANILRSKFANASASFDADEKAGIIKTVKKFQNGTRIVRLLSEHALDIESAELGHCIGDGNYDDDLNKDHVAFYSLRDAFNRAHATLQVEDKILLECKGKENTPPIAKYMQPVQAFIREQKLDLSESYLQTGLLKQDDQYFDIRDLPAGFAWGEDVIELEQVHWLKKLPERFSVRGHMTISDCEKFESIGKESQFESLRFQCCPSLRELGENIRVYGVVSLVNCPQLLHIPNNLRAEELEILNLESLTNIGDHLDIKHDIVIEECPALSSIGNKLKVGGNLEIGNCESLSSIGNGAHIDGTLEISSCALSIAIGDDVFIGDNLIINHRKTNISVGENLDVQGNIYWHSKTFTSVEEFLEAIEERRLQEISPRLQLRMPKGCDL